MILALEEFGLPTELQVWQAAILLMVSFGTGVLGGFVGLALGTIRLPTLILLGIASPTAAGTNIIVSSVSALTGAVRYLREGRVDMGLVLVMGVPSFVGAFIGGFSSGLAPEPLLLLAIGLLVSWQGVEFAFRSRDEMARTLVAERLPGGSIGSTSVTFSRNRALLGATIGFAIGLLGGAVGLILGSLRLPAMIRILEIDPRTAAGTNLVIGSLMGAVGWIGHLSGGHVDYVLLVLLGTSAMAGSYLGATLTGRVGVQGVITTMGLVLLVVGAILVGRALTL